MTLHLQIDLVKVQHADILMNEVMKKKRYQALILLTTVCSFSKKHLAPCFLNCLLIEEKTSLSKRLNDVFSSMMITCSVHPQMNRVLQLHCNN